MTDMTEISYTFAVQWHPRSPRAWPHHVKCVQFIKKAYSPILASNLSEKR